MGRSGGDAYRSASLETRDAIKSLLHNVANNVSRKQLANLDHANLNQLLDNSRSCYNLPCLFPILDFGSVGTLFFFLVSQFTRQLTSYSNIREVTGLILARADYEFVMI